MARRITRLLGKIADEANLGLVPVLTLAPISIVVIFLQLSLMISVLAGLGAVAAFAAPVTYYLYRREQKSLKALTSPGGWVSKKKTTEE